MTLLALISYNTETQKEFQCFFFGKGIFRKEPILSMKKTEIFQCFLDDLLNEINFKA